MSQSIITIVLAFFGYSMLNIGQAGQKIGLEMRDNKPVLGWSIWGGATAATALSFLLVFGAIAMGSVSIVGAMAGTGLASLALFSHVVMKESLNPMSLIAIAAIIAAAAVLAIFDQTGETTPNVARLIVLLGVGAIAYIGLIFLAPSQTIRGVAIGGLSGFFGAASQLFQRLGTVDIDPTMGIQSFAGEVISEPVTLVWVGLTLISMVVMQFSYRHAQTVQIVPVFTANFIIIPAVGGVIAFGEVMHPMQWVAVAVMLTGSIVITRRKGGSS
jgi:drug/metabolite transporter (DMT)-like permease